MTSNVSFQVCFALRTIALPILLTACASTREREPEPAPCGQGTLVESESGAFCVYRSELVIEGGFECPASFEFKHELSRGVACGERELPSGELPPLDVCRELGVDCEITEPLGPPLEAYYAERIGAPGECVEPCDDVEDCLANAIGLMSAVFGADNRACIDGACRHTGCNDDDECSADYPNTVCRTAELDEVPMCKDACEQVEDCLGEGEAPSRPGIECVEGACLYVPGCTSDEQCPSPMRCVDSGLGYRDCFFTCDTAQDCAETALEESGLDEPVPTDPWNYAVGFDCREGRCHLKELGCSRDEHCDAGQRCKL